VCPAESTGDLPAAQSCTDARLAEPNEIFRELQSTTKTLQLPQKICQKGIVCCLEETAVATVKKTILQSTDVLKVLFYNEKELEQDRSMLRCDVMPQAN
jgi:hypothetical protein